MVWPPLCKHYGWQRKFGPFMKSLIAYASAAMPAWCMLTYRVSHMLVLPFFLKYLDTMSDGNYTTDITNASLNVSIVSLHKSFFAKKKILLLVICNYLFWFAGYDGGKFWNQFHSSLFVVSLTNKIAKSSGTGIWHIVQHSWCQYWLVC